MKIIRSFIMLSAIFFLHSTLALAFSHTIIEDQALTFGKFAMRDNGGQYTIIVSPDGVETYHPKLLPFDIGGGAPAIFLLTDFPPDTELSALIADTVLIPGGAGPQFDIINFTFAPAIPVTNGAGSLTLRVGATLRTSGSGVLYDDGAYSGDYTLTISY